MPTLSDSTPPHDGDEPPLRPKEELLSLFRRVTSLMARPAEQNRLALAIVDEAAQLMRAAAACVLVPDSTDLGLLQVRAGSGSLAAHEGGLIPLDASFAGDAFLRRKWLSTRGIAAEPSADIRIEKGLGGPACAVPLNVEGVPAAVLLVARDSDAPPFDPAEIELLQLACEAFASAFAGAARFDQARAGRGEIEVARRLRDASGWRAAYEAAAAADRLVVFRWHLDSGVFRWGSTIDAVFGFDVDAFGALLPDWLGHIGDGDRDRVGDALLRACADSTEVSEECVLRHRSGAFRRALVRLLPTIAGEPTVRIGTLNDITDRHRSDQPLREQRIRSEAAAEVVHAIRHEINNPLAAVIGQLQLLQRETQVSRDPALRDAIRTIHTESTRIRDVLHRLAMAEHGAAAGGGSNGGSDGPTPLG